MVNHIAKWASVATHKKYIQLLLAAFDMEANAAEGTPSVNEGLEAMKNCEGDEDTDDLESDMLDLFYSNNPTESDFDGF